MSQNVRIRSLVLAGGQSSRMGSPKHLLKTPIATGICVPLIAKIVRIHEICQETHSEVMKGSTAISIRDVPQREQAEMALTNSLVDNQRVYYLADTVLNAGPSSGLVRAHEQDPEAHWLVTGCDYPLLEVDALATLVNEHLPGNNAITCFRNAEDWNEPLLAIWSPIALRHLQELSRNDQNVGPNRIIREFSSAQGQNVHGVRTLTPAKASWLSNVNTREEWEAIQPELRAKVTGSSD